MVKNKAARLVTAGFLLALGVILPQIFGRVQFLGMTFLPMHLPVLLCGAICGGFYGALCGALTPLICSMLFSMPVFFPTAIAMAVELCCYGLLISLLYRRARLNIYPSLLLAMLGGRLLNGLVNWLLLGLSGKAYTLATFISACFVTGIPGIILQIVLIPVIVLILQKAGFIERKKIYG